VGSTKEETVRINKNLEVGKKLPNVLAAGQLAQWVMRFCYGKIGGPHDAKEIEKKLNDLINSRFVCGSSNPSIEEKFKYQFAAAEVKVVESDRAGHYEAVVKVRPFDVFEGMDAAIELRADLGSSQGNSGS
jgi:predicted component of type VI protein secretion system